MIYMYDMYIYIFIHKYIYIYKRLFKYLAIAAYCKTRLLNP